MHQGALERGGRVKEAPKEARKNHPAEEKLRGAGGKVRRGNGHGRRKDVKGNRRNGEEKMR